MSGAEGLPSVVVAGVAAAVLALLHWGARYMTALDRVPRSRWLSAASGVSVAYVFIRLLPEVAAAQSTLEEVAVGLGPAVERHSWLLALLGLVVFYGLQQHARRSRREAAGGTTADEVGWIHIVVYAGYNALVGYLLLEEVEQGLVPLALFTVAIGLHFIVNDHGLREDHGPVYHDAGRWVLAAAVLVGWLVSVVAPLHEAAVSVPLAFLAGAIVLNVMKEELPADRESRFWPFATAAAAYSALLVVV